MNSRLPSSWNNCSLEELFFCLLAASVLVVYNVRSVESCTLLCWILIQIVFPLCNEAGSMRADQAHLSYHPLGEQATRNLLGSNLTDTNWRWIYYLLCFFKPRKAFLCCCVSVWPSLSCTEHENYSEPWRSQDPCNLPLGLRMNDVSFLPDPSRHHR